MLIESGLVWSGDSGCVWFLLLFFFFSLRSFHLTAAAAAEAATVITVTAALLFSLEHSTKTQDGRKIKTKPLEPKSKPKGREEKERKGNGLRAMKRFNSPTHRASAWVQLQSSRSSTRIRCSWFVFILIFYHPDGKRTSGSS